jgi:hypothetical protein
MKKESPFYKAKKVTCPKCNRIGILKEYPFRGGGYKWYVYHGKGERCDIIFGVLDSMYYYMRMAEEGRLEEALKRIPERWHNTFRRLFEV